ncbi:MAG: TetR/AcrR family transcriptional regulator [bacterium]|jgi:AcrR family transcriptional regulator|nr:TetR/AcrR family transcriptional regulator [bacterium]
MNRKAERGQATRDRLVAVATRLFAELGYEETSIEQVLHESGVSRGALYHHFGGKEALFEAVLEEVEQDIGRRLQADIAEADGLLALIRAGCLGWIRMTADPVIQQVLLVDAPSVLGWQRWRELDEQHTLGEIKALLAAVAQEGRLDPAQVDLMAYVWIAVMNEIALYIARAEDGEAARREGEAVVDTFLQRLLGA